MQVPAAPVVGEEVETALIRRPFKNRGIRNPGRRSGRAIKCSGDLSHPAAIDARHINVVRSVGLGRPVIPQEGDQSTGGRNAWRTPPSRTSYDLPHGPAVQASGVEIRFAARSIGLLVGVPV